MYEIVCMYVCCVYEQNFRTAPSKYRNYIKYCSVLKINHSPPRVKISSKGTPEVTVEGTFVSFLSFLSLSFSFTFSFSFSLTLSLSFSLTFSLSLSLTFSFLSSFNFSLDSSLNFAFSSFSCEQHLKIWIEILLNEIPMYLLQ